MLTNNIDTTTIAHIFDTAIRIPANFRRTSPPHFRIPFYNLKSHTVPLRWQLYRYLLRNAPNEGHAQAVRLRWRKSRFRYSTSPTIVKEAIEKEERVLRAYITLNRGQQLTFGEGKTRSKPTGSIPAKDTSNSTGTILSTNHEQSITVARENEEVASEASQRKMEQAIWREYRRGLYNTANTLRPIRTPGLIFPSLLNPGLPRLKPQPLHITMPITCRQKARDRRIRQTRAWEEMLRHEHQEEEFEHGIGELAISGGLKVEDSRATVMHQHLAEMQKSNELDFARAKIRFTREILSQRDEARRRTPKVLARVRRKKDLERKMLQLFNVTTSSDAKHKLSRPASTI